jgi:hypothetical protein
LSERTAWRTVNTDPRDGPQRNATTPAEACTSRRERASYYERRHAERVRRRAIEALERQGYHVTLEVAA